MDAYEVDRIKQLKLKRVAFRKELESFQAVLDIYDEEGSVNIIQNLLDELEEEYAVFKKTQSELDDIDNGQAMQERIDLKRAFNIYKGRAEDIIDEIRIRINELYVKKEKASPGVKVYQKLISSNPVGRVRCLSSMVHNVESNLPSPLQDNRVNFVSKTMAETSSSTMVEQSGFSSINTTMTNIHQNVSTFNNLTCTSRELPELSNIIAKDHSRRKNIRTVISSWLQKVFAYCCVSSNIHEL
jgi:hypothetical protein